MATTDSATATAACLADGIPVYCAYDALWDPRELTRHPRNPNTHPPAQLERYIDIIKTNGWRRAITVSELTGNVTRGNGALLAALQAGWTEVPVDYQPYMTEKEEVRDLIADNELARQAETDEMALAKALNTLDALDLPATGLPEQKAQELLGLLDEEALPPIPDEFSEVPLEATKTMCPKCGHQW